MNKNDSQNYCSTRMNCTCVRFLFRVLLIFRLKFLLFDFNVYISWQYTAAITIGGRTSSVILYVRLELHWLDNAYQHKEIDLFDLVCHALE